MTDPKTLSSIVFPDPEAKRRLAALVGVESTRDHLQKSIALSLRPTDLDAWARKHTEAAPAVELLKRRAPLFILGGDIGTGKTELAETIGDSVSRELDIPVYLYRLGLSARGGGLVGEMTQLLGAAFDQVVREASKWSEAKGPARAGAILFIDEADALAQSRETSQMHHEDRAGVNALIRGIDDVARARLPIVVLMATNRLGALDPAVRRRAARVYEFKRPDEAQREDLLRRIFPALRTSSLLPQVVAATGPRGGAGYGMTYSDIVQRVVPDAVLLAFPKNALSAEIVFEAASSASATPPFTES